MKRKKRKKMKSNNLYPGSVYLRLTTNSTHKSKRALYLTTALFTVVSLLILLYKAI